MKKQTLRPALYVTFFCLVLFTPFLALANSPYDDYRPTGDEQSGFELLQTLNPDVFGWITVFGTGINYPLVQGADNFRYLDTNASGQPSASGAIFLDARNRNDMTDFNNIIYGHDMARNAMFGEIDNFQYTDYFDERQFGSLFTGERHYGIEFFAFMLVDANDTSFYHPTMNDEDTKQQHLNRILMEARQLRPIDVTTQDRLVMLSTCTPTATNGRFVLIGRLIETVENDPFVDDLPGTSDLERIWLILFDRPFRLADGLIIGGVGVLAVVLFTVLIALVLKRLNKRHEERLARKDGKTKKPPTVIQEFFLLAIKIALILSILVMLFLTVFGIWQADDLSMVPAIQEGDLILFTRTTQSFTAGDTVVIDTGENRQARRVVATAGDVVDITEEGFFINDVLQQEYNIFEATTQFVDGIYFPFVVPRDELFVLGDHRSRSVDSRLYGSVQTEDVLGRIRGVIRRRNL